MLLKFITFHPFNLLCKNGKRQRNLIQVHAMIWWGDLWVNVECGNCFKKKFDLDMVIDGD